MMAGIYIKGMEMPKYCSACFCNAYHWCQVLDRSTTELLITGRRFDDCPLIPVPDHGRLVILPCKVGDTFFFLSETIHGEMYVAQSRVSDIVITGDALMIVDSDGCYHYTYWFTRAEAEAALKGWPDDV